jgi:branched-chain amino acid transport system ATP-binding protein
MPDPILSLIDVHAGYDGVPVVFGVSMEVMRGELVAVVGANGAGKSTTLRAIGGLVEKSEGRILFQGREIQHRPAHLIVRDGISLVPEGRRIFVNLSVEENLLMGAYPQRAREEERRNLEAVYQLFPRLKERKDQKGGTLSGGEQQMLALGRGLMACPALLMLDEPSLGLAPKLVREVFGIIRSIPQKGVTILLVEQNAKAALQVADHGYVLQGGRISLEGGGKDLLGNPLVQEAYLGAGERSSDNGAAAAPGDGWRNPGV